jgi:hypothetical protein
MDATILVGLILINGFFAMSEISLVTARKARLQRLIDSGDKAAKIAVQLGSEPTKFLSTVQIGITAVGMLSGIVGEAALAPPLATWLLGLGVSEPARGYIATALVVATITYFAIVGVVSARELLLPRPARSAGGPERQLSNAEWPDHSGPRPTAANRGSGPTPWLGVRGRRHGRASR